MKRIWQWLATALLVAIFLSLANWQWNRAGAVKNPPQIDQTILPLDSLIAPSDPITDSQIGRRVTITGKYVSLWQAPNQKANSAGQRTWQVGLLQTKDNAMILVVRGYEPNGNSNDLSGAEVTVTGTLLPPQGKDVAQIQGNQLSRVDSSLFVSRTDLPLYAPFINAISEVPKSNLEKVEIKLSGNVPGYYWQHISYVVIWFLFAVTSVYLMLYHRSGRVEP